jgi:hypothetical protein
VGHVARIESIKNASKIWVTRNLKRRQYLGELGVERIIVITINLKEIGYEDVYWIRLAQYKVRWRADVNVVMNLAVL